MTRTFATSGGGGSGTFLKLDQTTPQTVSGGSPNFSSGIRLGSGSVEKIFLNGSSIYLGTSNAIDVNVPGITYATGGIAIGEGAFYSRSGNYGWIDDSVGFWYYDPTYEFDQNKKYFFDGALISNSTTRTYSVPNKDGTIALTSDIGSWGALNYPTWSSGTPFVKMTAAGTFALDTNTYLTSLSGALLADGSVTGATTQSQAFTNGITLNATSIVTDTTTGLKIGTAIDQKLGFWNATPIVQPANTTAIDTLLVNTGLMASGATQSLFANNVNISKTTPTLTLTSTDGSNNTATFSRSATSNSVSISNTQIQQGSNPNALQFNGSLSQKVTTGVISSSFVQNGDFTILVWVYPSGTPSTQTQAVNGREFFGDTAGYFTLAQALIGGQDGLWFEWYDGAIKQNYVTYNQNAWNCIAITRSGTTITIYNKTKNDSRSFTAGNATLTSNLEFFKGYSALYNTGKMDELAFFKRTLTAGEINDYYNSGNGYFLNPSSTFPSSGTPISTNLTALYHFDSGSGTTAIDSSSNGYNGTLVNSPTWVTGKVSNGGTVSAYVLRSSDGVNSGERGTVTLGDYSGSQGTNTIIEGLTTRFNVLGSEKGQLSGTGLSFIDNFPIFLGSASDGKLVFTGTQLQLQSDLVTASDSLLLRGGTNGVAINVGATAQHTITSLTDTLADGLNFVLGSSTGTKIGTATTQKLGFWNATPIVQPANTVAIDTLLVNTGLRASGNYANFATTIQPRTGTQTANTAPIKFTSGPLLSTTEAGAFEFLTDDYYGTITTGAGGNFSYYPPSQSSTYVKSDSEYSTSYHPYFCTDPAKSLIGDSLNNAWLTANVVTPNVLQIDLGTAKSINKIYYENFHLSGGYTSYGVKDFTLWGSNTANFSTVDPNSNTDWTQITAGLSQTQFDIHASTDTTDPKYITLTPTTAYRYYRIKITSDWGAGSRRGLRRIELQDTTQNIGRKKVVLTDTESGLTTGRIPVATTNGRVTDSPNLTWDGTVLGVIGSVSASTNVLTPVIKTDTSTPTDLTITTGANKTLILGTSVYEDIQFPVATGKVPAANFPTWETFTTNTEAYAFSVDDRIQLQANEPPHGWKEGTNGSAHIHFAIKTAQNTGEDRFVKFEIIFAYADYNGTWTEQAALTSEATIPTGSAALKNFLLTDGTVTLTGLHLGSQIRCRVRRIAATGGTEYEDDVYITQVGIHVEVDTIGSRTVSSK